MSFWKNRGARNFDGNDFFFAQRLTKIRFVRDVVHALRNEDFTINRCNI